MSFLSWLRDRDLPDPEEVLRDPGSAPIPARLDARQATASAVVAAALAEVGGSVDPSRVEAALAYLERLPRDVAAVSLPPIGEYLAKVRRNGGTPLHLPQWVVDLSRTVVTLRSVSALV